LPQANYSFEVSKTTVCLWQTSHMPAANALFAPRKRSESGAQTAGSGAQIVKSGAQTIGTFLCWKTTHPFLLVLWTIYDEPVDDAG